MWVLQSLCLMVERSCERRQGEGSSFNDYLGGFAFELRSRPTLNATECLVPPHQTSPRQTTTSAGLRARENACTTDLENACESPNLILYTKTSLIVYFTSANPLEHGSVLHDNLNLPATPSHFRNRRTNPITMGFLLTVFLLLVIAAGAVYTWVLVIVPSHDM